MSCCDQGDPPATSAVPSTTNTGDEVHHVDRDRVIPRALAANEDRRYSDHVAWAIDGRNQTISREVHHALRGGRDSGDAVVVGSSEVAGTLRASRGTGFRSNGTPVEGVAIMPMGPRRYTPRECERLQGFPDDFTLVPFRGKPAKDSPRYKALGNSMPVPVMYWIGERIAQSRHHGRGHEIRKGT
jgi:site-specific DNA-cytosine methylase